MPPEPWLEWGKRSVLLSDLDAAQKESPPVLSELHVRWELVEHITASEKDIVLQPLDAENRRWQLQLEHFFKAIYDHDEHTVHMQIVRDDLPQLTLQNVLRFITSIRLPLENKGLMLHASSGGTDVGAVFSGLSTAGKSTLAFGFENVEYYSDDISLLTYDDDKVWLTGSPFFGIEGHRGAQKRVPLAAFCLLEEKSFDGKTYVERLSKTQAISSALRHVVSFSDAPALAQSILDQLLFIADRVPFVRIHRSLETSSDDVFAQVMDAVQVST